MITSLDKAIVAAVLSIASIVNLLWGFDLFGWGDQTEHIVGTLIAVLLPIAVWLMPNRRIITPIEYRADGSRGR